MLESSDKPTLSPPRLANISYLAVISVHTYHTYYSFKRGHLKLPMRINSRMCLGVYYITRSK
jgi:predicted transcriptional regulator